MFPIQTEILISFNLKKTIIYFLIIIFDKKNAMYRISCFNLALKVFI